VEDQRVIEMRGPVIALRWQSVSQRSRPWYSHLPVTEPPFAMSEHVGHPIGVSCILNSLQIFEVCQRGLPNAKRFGMAELLATRRDLRRD
jgi:hypothetical protein